ncbi:hypothetical protein BLGI_353 [Brevibacillus laterosporus GI-9]|nr:hypothetical protein BLGI_353 [Brevibacillus laterosporus GI-9]
MLTTSYPQFLPTKETQCMQRKKISFFLIKKQGTASVGDETPCL